MPKVPMTTENSQQCLCPQCPTYQANDCPKTKSELLYCANGKTACELPDKGCICGTCPVFSRYSLSGGYFCFNGEAV